jgi:hypothetical protein
MYRCLGVISPCDLGMRRAGMGTRDYFGEVELCELRKGGV